MPTAQSKKSPSHPSIDRDNYALNATPLHVIIYTRLLIGTTGPDIPLPKLDVVVRACRLERTAPHVRHLVGADGDERDEFAGAAAAAAEGGDFGGEVTEEMGHGDEAAADDAGCDFGDASVFNYVRQLSFTRCGGCK